MSIISFNLLWEVINNIAGEGNNKFFHSKLTLTNNCSRTIKNSGWKLYFNYIRLIYNKDEDESTFTNLGLKLKRYSGSLYRLEPLGNWKNLEPGESITIEFKSSDWAILKADAPLGAHIQLDNENIAYGLNIEVGDFITPEQTKRFYGDNLPVETCINRFTENRESQVHLNLNLQSKIIPRPAKVTEGKGDIIFTNLKYIVADSGLIHEAEYLSCIFNNMLDVSTQKQKENSIFISIDKSNKTEGSYKLTSSSKENNIQLTAGEKSGIFYGLQTLKQILFISNQEMINEFIIEDEPRFGFRGLMIDIARHFQSKNTLLKMIDLMAGFKLNKLHLHFCDDEGWRLELKSLPELTEYGSKRGFDPDEKEMLNIVFGTGTDRALSGDNILEKDKTIDNFYNFKGLGSGYYSEEDFIEILKYADSKHIEIIPEIDVPGHCRAAIKSMEYRYQKSGDTSCRLIDTEDKSKYMSVQLYNDNVINPCLESTYNFLQEVVKGIGSMYKKAQVPLNMIHLGGDEVPAGVWEDSPCCNSFISKNNLKNTKELKDYFFKRFISIIHDNTDATVSGWDDIVMDNGKPKENFVQTGFTSLSWSNIYGWGGEENAYKLANRGYNIVLSSATHLYFDLAYNKDPDEIGYYWAGFVDTKKSFYYRPYNLYESMLEDRMGNKIDQSSFKDMEKLNKEAEPRVLGLQGLLWGENSKSREILEYQAFPKLLGVAERAWNINMPEVENMEHEWSIFSYVLGHYTLLYLDNMSVNYRIPLPGAVIQNGVLDMNLRYNGLILQYSIDAGKTWIMYNENSKPKIEGPILVRAGNKSGTRFSRVATLP